MSTKTKKKMSLKEATSRLCGSGMTIRRTDCGEYRVNFRGGAEATAYYSDDIDDAYATALLMRQRQQLVLAEPAATIH